MHTELIKTKELRTVVFREEIPFGQQIVPSVQQQIPAANAENDQSNYCP